MAVAEEEFLLSNKDDQEKWLLLDSDASFSDSIVQGLYTNIDSSSFQLY
jgi:hypothetical protein